MEEDPELPSKQFEIEYFDKKLSLYWDGFCLTISSEDKYAFVASVNDPDVSPFGNASMIFGTADEIAQRLDINK